MLGLGTKLTSSSGLGNLRRDYNFLEGSLHPDIDFSRASSATQKNSEGKICYAPHNLLDYSEDITNNWIKFVFGGASRGFVGSQTDPFGGTDATKIVLSNADTSTGGQLFTREFSAVQNQVYVLSVYLKGQVGGETVQIDFRNQGSSGIAGSSVTLTTEWQRFSAVFTSDATATRGLQLRFLGSASDQDFYFFGAQVEQTFDSSQTTPSAYYKTSGAAYQAPRFDYDKDGNSKGLLIEEGRTNLFTYSQDLSQWNWVSGDGHILANAAISPAGSKNATKIIPNATDGNKLFRPPSVPTATQGNTYCMSVYVKKAGHRYFKFYFNDSASRLLHVDLDTGQGTLINASGGHSVEEVGNDWYRVWFSHTIVGSGGIGSIYWNSSNSSGFPVSFTGDGSSGVLVWGAQFEQGNYPSTLIPTYGATASRSADLAKVDGTNFSRFFKDTEGTTVVDVQLPTGLIPNYSRVYNFSNLSTSDEIEIWLHGGNYKVYGQIKKNSVNQGANPASNVLITSGEIAKLGQSYKTNSHSIIQDGFTGFNDTTVNLPTNISQLNLGGRHNNQSQLNGWIRRLRYFNKQLSDTKIKKLTNTSFLLDKFKGATAAHSLRSLRDGRDNSPVTRIRREYDSHEADYTANQVANGELEKDFRSADQTTLPLNISCEADEMVVNGAFDSNTTGWTAGGGATLAVDNGRLKITNNATGNSYANQTLTTKVGSQYTVSLDYIDNTGGNALVWVGTSFGGNQLGTNTFTTSGHYTLTFTATATTSYLRIGANEPTNGTIYFFDNVSVKEVNPIATGFSTRKINSSYTGKAMRCRNQQNVEVEVDFDDNNEISLSSPVTNSSQNLLAYSENFGEWLPTNFPVLVNNLDDPFGGQNAWSITSTTNGSYHQIRPPTAISITPNSTYTFSWYVKKESSRTNYGGVGINLYGGTSKFAYVIVDEVNGTATYNAIQSSTNTPIISVTEPVTGWWRVSVTLHDTHSNNQAIMYLYAGFSTNNTILSPVAGSARTIFGAMFEETVYEDTPSGSEIITNGTFDADSNWTKQAGWSIANGVATQDGSQIGAAQIYQTIPTVTVGKKYQVTYDLTITAGTVDARFQGGGGTTIGATRTTSGTYTDILTPTLAHDTLRIRGGITFEGTIDNVSLKELLILSPSTYAQTPVISDDGSNTTATTLGEFSGLENKLSYSEDFSQSIYTKIFSGIQDASQIVDPFGGNNAVRLAADTNNGQHRLDIPTTVGTGLHTFSVYAKAAEYGSIWLRRQGSSSVFNLENGTVISDSGNNNPTITAVGNDGWYRVSITNTGSANDTFRINFAPTNSSTADYVGDGTSGIYIFGAQLNTDSLKKYQKTSGTALTGDVHVVNWYDQGGGEDFTQSTAGEQPRIVMGSELVTSSGKASVYFDGGDTLDNNALAGQNRLDSYFIQDTSDNKYVYPTDPNSSSHYGLVAEDGSSSGTLALDFGTPSYYVNGALQSFSNRNDVHDRLTGKINLVSQHNTSTSDFGSLEVGQFSVDPSYNYTGKISEMVFFPNMDSSPKRFPIEQNMIQHFMDGAIYSEDFNDDTGGWTFSSGGAGTVNLAHETTSPISGSGSLRITMPSTGTSTGYPRVRVFMGTNARTNVKYRLSFKAQLLSGTAECDIRFGTGTLNMQFALNQTFTSTAQTYTFTETFDTLATGQLDAVDFLFDGTKAPFDLLIDDVKVEELGVEGYLTKLHDQTGNLNHALQATAAYQPKLVNGGDLIKSGNHPAWEHVTASNMELFGKLKAARLDAWFVADTSDNRYLYPANYATASDHGFVAQDGSTSVSLIADYGGGNAKLYANGTFIGSSGSATRDEVHSALNGRKLVHHQDADTADWSQLQMGYYGSSSTDTFNFQGKFSEWIWYDSDQSTYRTGIESNINTHYNIY